MTRSSPNNKLKGLTRPRECIVIVRHTFSCAALSYGKLYGDKHVKNSGQASDMMMAKKKTFKNSILFWSPYIQYGPLSPFFSTYFSIFFFSFNRKKCLQNTHQKFFPHFFFFKNSKNSSERRLYSNNNLIADDFTMSTLTTYY